MRICREPAKFPVPGTDLEILTEVEASGKVLD